MNTYQVDIQTTVSGRDDWLDIKRNIQLYGGDCNILTRTIITVDPIDNIARCSVFTDDGKGNGDLMFSFEMA